jgi:hypothetical protein
MFRVWMEKGFISSSLCSPGRQLSLAPFWWLPWLVCAVVHAHSLVSCLCGSLLGLGPFGGSARLILIISSLVHYFFANLPSGNATWHNMLYVVLFAGINLMLQGSWRSSSTRLNED